MERYIVEDDKILHVTETEDVTDKFGTSNPYNVLSQIDNTNETMIYTDGIYCQNPSIIPATLSNVVLSEEEARNELIDTLDSIHKFWKDNDGTVCDRVEGAIHSVLAVIDGCNAGIPRMKLIPSQHPDDMEYCANNNVEYFPGVDICNGELHSMFINRNKK